MGQSLYEIANEILSLPEEPTDDQINALEMALEDKAENICRLIRQLRAEKEAFAEEERMFREKKLQRERHEERLKDYMLNTLRQLGVRSLKTKLFNPRIQKNSRPSIRCDGEIPADLARVRIELDGDRAYQAWKSGEKLPENIIVTEGEHLRI